ncbi:MAG: flagellar biosynthesis sigma factor [Cycloclasticus sp. Phe_18]|nr:MAG: flagellar biosynthesis sigma factor [Cycloclasticus sp. Phe_18]MDF1690139.1 RNA polymerase sigma factor FliA [Cycloclasticus sp.]
MNGIAMYTNLQAKTAGELVAKHAPLVKRIAYHLSATLPDTVLIEDLIQSGMVGLLEASSNFNDKHGASFATYAGIRIRGAMLDDVRRTDWTPRSVHRKAREITKVMRQIEHETGRDARDTEIASLLEITIEEYHKILQDSTCCRLFSTDEVESDNQQVSSSENILENINEEDFRVALANAISGLPEREQMVVSLYYDNELNLKEIGAVLGVSESRACQINNQAMLRLKSRLFDYAPAK